MTRGLIDGWTEVTARPAGIRATLTIAFRDGDDRWPELAETYWKGELPGLEEIPSSPFAKVQRGTLPDNRTTCYFKRFLVRDWRDWLKRMIRPSRARRALIGGQKAEARGFRVPEPVCAIEIRRAGMLWESVLITNAVTNAPSVHAWLTDDRLSLGRDITRKRNFLKALGAEVGRWHRSGLYHGDMRLGNILCEAQQDRFSFIWLDNERDHVYRVLPTRHRIQNLVQVNMMRHGLSRTDRMRIWQAYAEGAHLRTDTRKKTARRVAENTQRRWRKRGWL